MSRRRRVVLLTAAVICLVLSILYFSRSKRSSAALDGHSGYAHSALPLAEPGMRSPTGQEGMDWVGQPGVPNRRVAGHVLHETVPVGGATVTLTGSFGNRKMFRVTDASGSFDFGTLPAARYEVVATHVPLAPASLTVDLRDFTAKPAPDDLLLRLASCRGRLVGVVSDSSAGPLDGAEVCQVLGIFGRACTLTRSDGGYELCVEDKANVTVAARASGYGSSTVGPIQVAEKTRQDFALRPEAVLSGRVVNGRDGAPVAGAVVYIEPDEFGVLRDDRHLTTTDPEGRFTFTNLAGGAHRLEAWKDSSALHPAVGVVLNPGQTTSGVILRLEQFSTIRGIVRENGTPVSGAQLHAESSVASGQAITQRDGSFVLRLVPRGELRFVVDGYRVLSPAAIRVERPRVDSVRIEVQGMSSISGRVLLDGQAVPGATVRVGDEYDGRSSTTNARGEYVLRGFPPGSYRVAAESVDARGYIEPVVVGEGESHGGVDIVLNEAASISGTVLDTRGRPVAGAFVKFQGTANGDTAEGSTGVDGDFKVERLAGGDSYRASVKPLSLVMPDLKPPSDRPFPTVVVRDSQSHVDGVQLIVQRADLSISGTVVDASGEPKPDVVIRAFPETISPTDYYQVPSGISNTHGTFSIAPLEDGTYALRASTSGSSVTVRGIAAGRTDVRIELPATSNLTGRLVGFHKQPVVQAYLDHPGEFPPGIRAVVSGDHFEIHDLVPGHYRVKANAGAEAAVAEIDLPPGQTRDIVITNPGTASVDGQVVEFRTGAPVADVTCYAAPRSDIHRPIDVYNGAPTTSAADGSFHIEAPVGDIAIDCTSSNDPLVSDGFSMMTLGQGQAPSTRVFVVRRATSGIGTWIDAEIDPTLVPARLTSLKPGGSAEQAGLRANDLITALDGVDVAPLSYAGLEYLLFGRAIGSHAKVTVARGGQTFVADVVLSVF